MLIEKNVVEKGQALPQPVHSQKNVVGKGQGFPQAVNNKKNVVPF